MDCCDCTSDQRRTDRRDECRSCLLLVRWRDRGCQKCCSHCWRRMDDVVGWIDMIKLVVGTFVITGVVGGCDHIVLVASIFLLVVAFISKEDALERWDLHWWYRSRDWGGDLDNNVALNKLSGGVICARGLLLVVHSNSWKRSAASGGWSTKREKDTLLAELRFDER